MTRAIASRGSRVIDSRKHSFFYNPMWSHFGDGGPNPPGTYYHEKSAHMWNMFDQVLVRPALVGRFVDSELQVLTRAGDVPLLNRSNVPDTKVASDHLPLLFALDL